MTDKVNGLDPVGWARAPPKTGPLWQRLAYVIYNPEEKSILGRTPKKWGIVLTFYLIFYAVLALLFAACMGGLFLTLDMERPKWTLDNSLIGSSPGVACRPQLAASPGLRYRADNSSSYEPYTAQLAEFLKPYANDSWFAAKKECTLEDNFGFPDRPCVYIKLNKIFDWKPAYYDDVTNKIPEDMPEDLVQHIMELDPVERMQVWISCWDEAGNGTQLEFPWGRGLPARFYPYNEAGGRGPMLAVRIQPPANTVTFVRCRAWAGNIRYSKSLKEPSGYTRMQLLLQREQEEAGE